LGKNKAKYIPALRYNWLTFVFDPFVRWTLRELTFKKRIVWQSGIKNGNRVLDLGCGTGTLAILIKKYDGSTDVIGLDGDAKILRKAKDKINRTGLDIKLDHGMAFELPYPNNSFDKVFSTLFFHHLNRANKQLTMLEIYRILRPGGELHIADFGKPANFPMYLVSLVMRHLEETKDNILGLLPQMGENAGFIGIVEASRFVTLFGSLSLYKMQKPIDGHTSLL
jgi:ubiquinone/menaquinone biosynthesis C-methylase UbiE